MPKARVDNLDVPYSVSRRRVRYPRLEFRTGKLVVVMPKGKSRAEEIINKHKAWIKQKKMAIGAALSQSKKRTLAKRNVLELREMALKMVKEHGKRGFSIGRLFIRKMNSKWASHSRNRNLTLNSELRFLPKQLIEYVVFHEMVHSIERKHNERFWRLVERGFRNHQKMERELMAYWFLIRSKLG